jgi:hypothetical protein
MSHPSGSSHLLKGLEICDPDAGEGCTLLGVIGTFAGLLQPRLHGLGGDLLFVALTFNDFGKQSVLAALFLAFLVTLFDNCEIGFQRCDRITLGGGVAVYNQRCGHEVGFEAAPAAPVILLLRPGELALLVCNQCRSLIWQ